MAWWSPKSWFQKAPEPVPVLPDPDPSIIVTRWLANDEVMGPAETAPAADPDPVVVEVVPEPTPVPIPALVAPEGPFCWVPLDPEHPHAGLSSFLTDTTPPPGHVLCVLGLTPEVAVVDFMGKVIAWERLTPEQGETLENPPSGLRIEAAALRLLFR